MPCSSGSFATNCWKAPGKPVFFELMLLQAVYKISKTAFFIVQLFLQRVAGYGLPYNQG
jgi:hypothetical protein